MNAIAFIDSGVAGYATLVRAIKAETKVVVLDSKVNGVEQITRTLQQGHYQQVHVISHGSPGCLDLGKSQLSLDTLGNYASSLQTWFSESPRTLLIYGCNVAAGDAGAEFVAQLQELTGANIAASASLTGNAALGGNWNLEVTTDPDMDLDLVIDEKTQLAYQGVLEAYTVTTTDDENDGGDAGTGLSLREAIALSNENQGEDTITFDSSLSGGAIALTQTEPNGRGFPTNQDLDITDSVNIVGLGAKNLTIDGLNRGNGIFNIGGENTNVNLEGLTIANGDTTRLFFLGFSAGGAIIFGGANLTLKDSVIQGSDSTFGGAIINSGHASIINSTITDNAGNDEAYPGGAIYNRGTLEISNSTISNNGSRGIANRGTLEISNSTISNNNQDGLSDYASEIVNSNGAATITSSIIAGNTQNNGSEINDLSGEFINGGNNLIGDGASGFINGENGNIVGTTENPIDPQLGELQDNSGGTFTQELQEGSPAIDTGSNPNNLATDQRGEGFDRNVGNGTDIGAFEVQDNDGGNGGGAYIVTTLDDEDDGDLSQGDISLREAILNSNEGDTITFDSSLSGGTITLSLGELLIYKSLTIEGLGSENLTIDANDSSRVFNIFDGDAESKIDVGIDGLKITGGNVNTPNQSLDSPDQNRGGGIFNQENLTLSNSSVTDNSADQGGGIYNKEATIDITDSSVDNNYGGGIANYLSTVNISSSTIDENGSDDAFDGQNGGIFSDSSELNIFDSTVSNNLSFGGSGGIDARNSSTTNIKNSAVSNNSTSVYGVSGGIYSDENSILRINNGTISNNYGDPGSPDDPKGRGANTSGIETSGTTIITNSNISNNTGAGSGLRNSGNLDISNTTVTGNASDNSGGGITNRGTANINNSTISNNSGVTGGGINNSDQGILDLTNSTISDNFGGGVFNENSATVTSSIIANNTSSDVILTTVTPGTNTDDDVIGTKAFTSGGNNLIGRVDGFGSSGFNSPTEAGFIDGVNGDIVGNADNVIDPQLGELQDNGGSTLSQELLAGSPAIDTGSNPNNLATDQRGEGFDRTVGNGTDIGAFEVQDGGNGGGAYIVTTLDDEDDGDLSQGDISLREAILNSNEGDTITFDSNLSGGTINLSLGELLIDKNLTIDGLGADNLTIDATDIFGRVFNIDDGKNETNLDVTIDGLSITGGEAARQMSPGDTNPDTYGGGINNRENLNLNNSHVTGNSAVAGGGGIFNAAGALTINNSTISDNSSNSPRVGARGGGIFNETGVLTISNSTISNNSAFQSGGISSGGVTEINNSTISGNRAAVFAGGIDATGTITSSIVAGNINEGYNSNTNNNDLSGDLISGGNNLIGDRGELESFTDGVNGDIVGTTENPIDPQLGELQDNGGGTFTQELLAGSPAIDTGSNPDNLATDQRGEGFDRTVGNGTDIGAFEVQDNDGGNPHPGGATPGDDLLVGTPCDDTIDGLEGNDIISGKDGNDTLYGGYGNDILSGNNGNDVFALQSGQGTDVILDFTDGIDLFGLTNGLGFGSLNIVNNDCGNGVIIQDTINHTAIAFVNNIDAASLTEHDFISI